MPKKQQSMTFLQLSPTGKGLDLKFLLKLNINLAIPNILTLKAQVRSNLLVLVMLPWKLAVWLAKTSKFFEKFFTILQTLPFGITKLLTKTN